MLTFFAASHQKLAKPPSLKFSVSVIINGAETIHADCKELILGKQKKLTIASIP
jgi:hypothetical protein